MATTTTHRRRRRRPYGTTSYVLLFGCVHMSTATMGHDATAEVMPRLLALRTPRTWHHLCSAAEAVRIACSIQ